MCGGPRLCILYFYGITVGTDCLKKPTKHTFFPIFNVEMGFHLDWVNGRCTLLEIKNLKIMGLLGDGDGRLVTE